MSDEKPHTDRNKSRKRSSSKKHARSELDFIENVRLHAEQNAARALFNPSLITRHSSLIKGIGDDAAVIRHPRSGLDTVITADLLVEGVDFRLSTTTPKLLGYKSLAVSLSDVAAMGARPRWSLLSIGASARIWNGSFLDKFYDGYFELAETYGVVLIGGDVSRTGDARRNVSEHEPLVIDSIVVGEVKSGDAVFRSGARPGDKIFVTGALGGAAAGLRLLEQRARMPSAPLKKSFEAASARITIGEAKRRLIYRQLRPEPRSLWGQMLGEQHLATALIDLSDGISSDLVHLCRESNVGARIQASTIPVDPHIKLSGGFTNMEAMQFALSGGEDFELLFTISPRKASRLPKQIDGIHLTEIGEVTDAAGEILLVEDGRTQKLLPEGFRHF